MIRCRPGKEQGGFEHGGWSMRFFDADAMGPVIGEAMASTEALLFGRRTWQTMAAAWPRRAGEEPILLGGGKRLFPDDGRARRLELVSTSTASTGVVICHYRSAGG